MKLKEIIQQDYVLAMKEKNEGAKLALGNLKTKITEMEKSNSNQELVDSEIIKIISKLVKQRMESSSQYVAAGREDLANKEEFEITVLNKYLPKKMGRDELAVELKIIVDGFKTISNKQALIGKTIGEFNKKFVGLAEVSELRIVIDELLTDIN
jgi:uncharacterized protein YqeY